MSSLDEVRNERLRKLQLLKDKGIDPYPAVSNRDNTISEFLGKFAELLENKKKVTIAGRIMSLRLHGNSAFIDLVDGTGKVQGYLKKDGIGDEMYSLFSDAVDTGDFIEITGEAYITNKGQNTVVADSWRMLAKSIRQIPDAWYGLKDEEERYRRRYIDILLSEDLASMVAKKSMFWNSMRQFLLERNFIEVETPALENTTGGADARPFTTHHNALDIDVYLRISAGELWQKKLLVGGIPRTFEIGRIFRNEGMSNEHLQDYTQLEFYMAYSDYTQGMEMIKDLYRTVAQKTFGTTKFTIREKEIDFAGEWEKYDFVEMIKKNFNIDALATTDEEVLKKLDEVKIKYDPKATNMERGIDLLWKSIRKGIAGPGFLINVPVYLEPLAKRNRDNDKTVERLQVIIAGSEVGKGFSELNDPIDQRERFVHQQQLREAGDDEAQMADMEFVEALEYGMPPAFGFGVSERLFSYLMDKSIREAQLFPLLRPRDEKKAQ